MLGIDPCITRGGGGGEFFRQIFTPTEKLAPTGKVDAYASF
jgi:hypothetical protein